LRDITSAGWVVKVPS